jgi:hypothetical protein
MLAASAAQAFKTFFRMDGELKAIRLYAIKKGEKFFSPLTYDSR